jgi:DNA-binding NtrC family response regulator
MNGLELARAVSTAEGALPVVLITGDADMASQACAAEAGALEVLLKPIDEDMLITVIQRALFECRWTCGAWLSLMTKRRPGYWLKSGSALMSLGKLFAAARAVTRVPSRSARRKPTCSLRNDHT